MNERIQQLIRLADVHILPDDSEYGHCIIGLEKFAELIVEECANVLRAESERLYKLSAEEKDEVFASNFEICAEKCWDNEVMIKEHFGVKL